MAECAIPHDTTPQKTYLVTGSEHVFCMRPCSSTKRSRWGPAGVPTPSPPTPPPSSKTQCQPHPPTHLQVLPPEPLQRLHSLRLPHQRPLRSSSPLPCLSQGSRSSSSRLLSRRQLCPQLLLVLLSLCHGSLQQLHAHRPGGSRQRLLQAPTTCCPEHILCASQLRQVTQILSHPTAQTIQCQLYHLQCPGFVNTI
jgi:hypothetical protein